MAVAVAVVAMAKTDNVAEEVAWVVGNQPIYKSEIEETYRQMLSERQNIKGDPYCVIPEQLAIDGAERRGFWYNLRHEKSGRQEDSVLLPLPSDEGHQDAVAR